MSILVFWKRNQYDTTALHDSISGFASWRDLILANFKISFALD